MLFYDIKQKEMNFTVIATSFNDATIIVDFFKELYNQSIQPTEYILVDGGSKDETIEAIKNYSKSLMSKGKVPIRVICDGRLNIAEGYNRGIKEAVNDIIIIVGIGNSYNKVFFEELIKESKKNNAEIVYAKTIGKEVNMFSKAYSIAYLGGKNGIKAALPSNRGVLIKKSVFDKIGNFYEKFIYAGEDTEFFRRAIAKGIEVSYTDIAEIYWEVPRNLKEFIKQRKVYFIGGMQHTGLTKKIIKSYAFVLSMLTYLAFLIVNYNILLAYVPIVLFLIYECYKRKTFNLGAISLRFLDRLLDTVFFISYKKYSKGDYKVML